VRNSAARVVARACLEPRQKTVSLFLPLFGLGLGWQHDVILMTIHILIPAEQRRRVLEAPLILVGAIAIACFVLVPKAGLLALAGCVALGFLGMVCEVFRGRIDGILVWWAGLFPLRSLLTFPRDRSIITPERVVILLVFIGVFLAKPSTLVAMPKALRRTGLACMAFIGVAGVTLAKSSDVLGSARLLSDSFVIPLLFGWFVVAAFDVRRHLPALHTAVCFSSMFCAAVAAAEIVTAEDLLPVADSAMFYTGGIARPNGPFASNDQLALVGGLSLFFLLFLRSVLGPRLSAGRKVLHSIGLAAAIGMALMPMFRSVALTLLLVLLIDTFWEQRTSRRTWRVVLILSFAGMIFIGKVLMPDIFEDRSSTDNVFSRIAEYKQSLRVFADHPVLGVGFSNFNNFVVGDLRYRMFSEGVASVDWPHSNLSSALAETGLLGFVPYVITHVLLFVAMWQLRRSSDSGYVVWKYFFYIFLTYWITGLTESSGFEGLNIWYVFVIAVLYKYGSTASESVLPGQVHVPAEAMSASTRTFSRASFR
jgi:O-antigen ligase